MMAGTVRIAITLAAALAMTESTAWTATEVPVPEPNAEEGIRYLDGGVGIAQRQAMEAEVTG